MLYLGNRFLDAVEGMRLGATVNFEFLILNVKWFDERGY